MADKPGMDEESTVAFPGVESLTGKRLGEFRILREIGRGSMGIVFEAMQENLNRRVALKILPPTMSLPEKAIRRFLREAESVAKLQHENIVQIYAVSKKDAMHYYAMQFVEGEPLDVLLKAEHPLPFVRVARLMCQTAEAIHYAHQFGIIHRDIKPGNILVTPSYKVVMTDFGLARQERGATLTESGALVGTPIYMSPEQILGRKGEVGKSSDIYSIGVTLYELLTGRPPFCGENTQEILNSILDEDPKPPRKLRPEIPWELEVIAMKAMEKEPHRRFASAQELADDLKRYLAGEPIRARPSGVLSRLVKKVRKHRLASGLALAAVVILAALLANTLASKGVQKDMESYERAIHEGQLILDDGDLQNDDQAIAAFQRAVDLFPLKAESHLLLGQAHLSVDDMDGALAAFEKAVNLDPENGAALLQLCRVQLRHEDMEVVRKGLGNLMAVRTLEPESFSIALDWTKLLYQIANEAQAQNLLESGERRRILGIALQLSEQALRFGRSADMLCTQALILYEIARLSPGQRDEYLEQSLQKVEEAAEIDRNNRMAFELKREIERSVGGPFLVDLYKFVRNEGLGEWAISQGSALVGPALDFLKKELLPTVTAGEPPKEGEPDM